MTYPDMKNFYPIQDIDLKFHVDHKNTEKIQVFEKSRGNWHNAHGNGRLIAI